MPKVQRLSDPRVLRAIAHPVRARILEEVAASGPVRAADIARELAIPANQASFHLRQLAKYGMVEEAPEEARDRRDRVWRAVAERGFSADLGELSQAPGGRAAVEVYRRRKLAWTQAVAGRAFASDRSETPGVFSTCDHALKLSDEEAREFRRELDEVIDRWADRTRGRVADRRTYLLLQMLQPYPDEKPS